MITTMEQVAIFRSLYIKLLQIPRDKIIYKLSYGKVVIAPRIELVVGHLAYLAGFSKMDINKILESKSWISEFDNFMEALDQLDRALPPTSRNIG